jgi:cholesterol transport system auxiliary component
MREIETMRPSALLILAAALPLAACFSFGADPPDQLLTLKPAATVEPGRSVTAAPGEAITVAVPTVPQALATPRVPVRATDTSIAYVKDAQWSEQPNRLFQQLLSETIQARTGRPVLSPRQFSFDPGVRLAGELVMFGVDAATRSAVVTYDAAVSRDGGAAIETRRFEARVPVSAIEAIPVGEALNQAANQVAADVAAWIAG